MKKLFYLLITVLLLSCTVNSDDDDWKRSDSLCNSSDWPSPPYPNPDDISTYVNKGYKSIDYIWYCKNGKYVTINYKQADYCELWVQSENISNGICK